MKIETSIRVDAPPPVAFRFYGWLDYLRFVSADLRQEWCPERGIAVCEGAEYEVLLEQGKHRFSIRFRTTRVVDSALYEDEFLTWPVKGGRHLQTFEPEGERTLITESHAWSPPWYARAIVAKKRQEQTEVFQERLENGKRIIEAVYRLRGDEAFREGIFQDCEAAGIMPIIPQDR